MGLSAVAVAVLAAATCDCSAAGFARRVDDDPTSGTGPLLLKHDDGAARISSLRCATCKPPVHSWSTLPVSFHSSEHVTNERGEFTEAEIATISRFPLVTIVRSQHSSILHSP